ncbi:MAG: VOC family protein [Cyclobacteriaceae bacterium]|jgi:predicted 3-demethylubiquinone-9 3-methyltransferase (glyoxalase superfamily)|nr:VOC family protein [Cyclobacteriaceae bacterium]
MIKQKITPCVWIEKDAKTAAEYYLSIFKKGKLKSYQVYNDVPAPGRNFDTATVNLMGMDFQLLAAGPLFAFNESVSFVITCKDQAEVDYYWESLTAQGGSEGPCGWVKDKYGLSWQVVPEVYFQLANHKNKATRQRALEAMLQMKKIMVAELAD